MARLPPQRVLVAAEAIERESREGGEVQEVLNDIWLSIETTVVCWCGDFGFLFRYQMRLILIRQVGWSNEAQPRRAYFALARLADYGFERPDSMPVARRSRQRTLASRSTSSRSTADSAS